MAFEGLSSKLQAVINKLKGKSRITEADIKDSKQICKGRRNAYIFHLYAEFR